MENSTTVYDKKMSNLVGIGLILGFLLPHTSNALLLVNPLFCLMFQCFKQNRVFFKKNWSIIIPLLITLVLNIGQVDIKSQLSFAAILLYVFCFPFVVNVRINNIFLYFILFVVLLSQMAYVFRIPTLSNFFDTYYPISEQGLNEFQNMVYKVGVGNMFNFRHGGLYRNSNICSKSICFLLMFFLYNNKGRGIKKIILFVVTSMFIIVLTGSRTGFFVGGLTIMLYLFLRADIKSYWKWGAAIVFSSFFIYLIVSNVGGYRALDLESAWEGSGNSKWRVFIEYISGENSVVRLLFGYFDTSRWEKPYADILSQFDSDYGDLIFAYGIIGFTSFMYFFYSIFRRVEKMGKAFFILLLWMISSTVVTSYRFFFIYMLMLSIIYSDYRNLRNNINNI